MAEIFETEGRVLKKYRGDSVAKLVIPDGISCIGEYAFFGCGVLSNVTIPAEVTEIGGSAFAWCSALVRIIFCGTKAQWKAIAKGDKWDKLTGNYIVRCKDGDLTKAEAD